MGKNSTADMYSSYHNAAHTPIALWRTVPGGTSLLVHLPGTKAIGIPQRCQGHASYKLIALYMALRG